MKLELKHLVLYLDKGLKLKINDVIYDFNGLYKSSAAKEGWVVDVDSFVLDVDDPDLKLILRPLSDLENNYFMHESGDMINHIEMIDGDCYRWILVNDLTEIKVRTMDYLIMNHFDVSGLIPAGLAIDINTLDI